MYSHSRNAEHLVRTSSILARILAIAFAAFVMSSCQAPESDKSIDSNSMEAIMLATQERLAMPGRKHYETACAACHEGAVSKAPHREMISLMTPESILKTLATGVMQTQSAGLSAVQQREVAEYLGGREIGDAAQAVANEPPQCTGGEKFDLASAPTTQNWGLSPGNGHYIPAQNVGVDSSALSRLEPRWALSAPGANRVRSQPLLAGGLLFVGSHAGAVYALDQATGCSVWTFQASGEVRTGVVIDPWTQEEATALMDAQATPLVYFGDVLGNVYALNASSGQLVWRDRADAHPNATITGTPSLHKGSLYVPVSALEVSNAIDPAYPCCTFRGSVVAYDASSGQRRWQGYTIPEAPTQRGTNAAGTPQWGPSGAVIWNSPAIDAARNQLYVGTGENASSPASQTSDSIIAMDLATGAINWVFQATSGDAWNTACDTGTPENCPEENGPDFDFGAPIVLVGDQLDKQLVVGGQKSGLVHAVDPDTGELRWQKRVGRGGIQGGVHFGLAADNQRIYVPITDMADGRDYPDPAQPGIHALDIQTGERLWYTPASDQCAGRAGCHPGYSQAITIAGEMVVVGGMDGKLRILSVETGKELMALDTTAEFLATNGERTRGGSLGGGAAPLLQNGLLVISSGYGIYNHMPGNLLLVMALPDSNPVSVR